MARISENMAGTDGIIHVEQNGINGNKIFKTTILVKSDLSSEIDGLADGKEYGFIKENPKPGFKFMETSSDGSISNEKGGNKMKKARSWETLSSCSLSMRFAPLAWCSQFIVRIMETTFYWLGLFIGIYPGAVIVSCLALVVLSCGGFAFFYEETDQFLLWSPQDAQAAKDQLWVEKNFGNKTMRPETILLVAENILEPEIIQEMLRLDQHVKSIGHNGSYDWESLCERLGPRCWSNSLLELWSFDQVTINALTKQDILDKINTLDLHSPVYFNEYDVTSFLGSIQYDQKGRIVSAKATIMTWMLKYNEFQQKKEEDWEAEFLDFAKNTQEVTKTFTEMHYFAYRSLLDEIDNAIIPDIKLLCLGYAIVLTFAALVLGKFNLMEQKILITLSGILCVGFSTAVAIGIGSYFGIFFANIHYILPFLLLGIGVDDMFVIAQSLETVQVEGKGKNLPQPEKIALALKRAGVSITVTSLTDALAFGVGATTTLPALHTFCIYAVVGILALLVFQALFFTACLTLDLRRQETNHDACCLCYIHSPKYTPNQCSQTELIPNFFARRYAPFLVSNPVRINVIICAIGLVAVMAWGTANLKQDSDPNRFFRDDSYLYKYNLANRKYFPGDGHPTAVYIGEVDYIRDQASIGQLYQKVLNDPYTYPGSMYSWHHSFYQWLAVRGAEGDPLVVNLTGSNFYPTKSSDFYQLLQIYMCNGAREGARFVADIVFSVGSACLPGNDTIKSSRMTLKHKKMDNSYEEIEAMESLRSLMDNSELPVKVFSKAYLSFETNKVIQYELYRNLGLAFLSVMLMTLVLLADLWMCLLVCLCVLMTLVDLGGLMYFWGLTIDVVTAVQFILAVGLAVDYAVHIAHTFLTVTGDRNERTKQTLHRMGAAVLYGGFSTFLAFVLLAFSASYIFIAFFKVFFGVVAFGLFHGLMFLPSLLSAVGPAPYLSAAIRESQEDTHNQIYQRHKQGTNSQSEQSSIQHIYTVPSTRSSMANLSFPFSSVQRTWQVAHWLKENGNIS